MGDLGFMNDIMLCFFFFSSRRRHTRFDCDWSSDVCSSDLGLLDRRSAAVARGRPRVLLLLGLQLLQALEHALGADDVGMLLGIALLQGVEQIGRASCRERV